MVCYKIDKNYYRFWLLLFFSVMFVGEEWGQWHCLSIACQLRKEDHKAIHLVKSGNYTLISPTFG